MSDVQSHLDRLERRLDDAEKRLQELEQINQANSETKRKLLREQRFQYPTKFQGKYGS